MSFVFSAYRQPKRRLQGLLAATSLVCLAVLTWVFICSEIPTEWAQSLSLMGGIGWVIALVIGYLRPNKIALGLGVLGAMLLGTGMMVVADPFCLSSSYCHPIEENPDGSFVIRECTAYRPVCF
jgi:hypothetical protein